MGSTMVATKVDAQLADDIDRYADDPERVELLQRARRFKSSWIELAQALIDVQRSGRFRDWGFESFDDYAKKELHLRPETVSKLTGSYQFLRTRAPDVLGRDGVATAIPSYQALDVLRRAEETRDAPRDVVDEFRRRVIDEGRVTPSAVREFKAQVFPMSAEDKLRMDAAGLRNVAKRLSELLAETRAVPKKLASTVKDAVDELLGALDNSEQDEEAA